MWKLKNLKSNVLKWFWSWMRVCNDNLRNDNICKLLFALLNTSKSHSIIILDLSDLLNRLLIVVLAINIKSFEKVSWHFSKTIVIYSVVMWVAIIQQKFSDSFVQQFEMIFSKLHEIRLNEDSQIVVLDAKNHVLTDSINDIFIE